MRPEEKYKYNAVCIDFDGVLADFSDELNEFGTPISGGSRVVDKLRGMGYKIIIHTSRPDSPEHISKLEQYLERDQIHYDEINSNSDSEWKSRKPLSDLYIDDRALQFTGDWDDILWQVISRNGNTVRERYEILLGMVRERAGQVRELDKFLSENTNWRTAPASTRFHLSEAGGLVRHPASVPRLQAAIHGGMCLLTLKSVLWGAFGLLVSAANNFRRPGGVKRDPAGG